MRYVLTNAQMREADKFTIETLEVPSLLLMERAGAALAEEAERLCPEGDFVRVGAATTAATGLSAPEFSCKGLSVEALCVADKFSADCKKNRDEFESWAASVFRLPEKAFRPHRRLPVPERAFRESWAKTPLRRIYQFVGREGAFGGHPSAFREITASPRKRRQGGRDLVYRGIQGGRIFRRRHRPRGKIARADIGIALPALSKRKTAMPF
ncbi:MAG: hypothetical protein ACLRSW_11095 [Christensenellaceae bacterium]